MAWKDRDDFGHHDRDMMGIHGDVLFDDPLGIRAPGSTRNQQTPSQKNAGLFGSVQPSSNNPQARGGHAGQQDDHLADLQQEPGEDAGVMTQWLWWGASTAGYLFAGGKQCCSMRDQTKDQEAAKKAAETGRPPPAPQQFPAPGQQGSARGLSPGAGQRPVMQGGRDQQQQQQRPPQHSRLDSDSDSDGGRYSMHRENRQEPPKTTPPQAQSSIARDLMSGGGGKDSITGGASVAASMPKRWEWPQWCLNFKEPCIEVYVVDEETDEGRWVRAEPQSRVVDKNGRDAYLCVEYEWDGEFYVQDFGPQNVRRRGDKKTVFDVFEDKDTGGGVIAFLGD